MTSQKKNKKLFQNVRFVHILRAKMSHPHARMRVTKNDRKKKKMTTMIMNEIKCNHFYCVGKSWNRRNNATTLVAFAGNGNVKAHETACCSHCFGVYSQLIRQNPSLYTVTEL